MGVEKREELRGGWKGKESGKVSGKGRRKHRGEGNATPTLEARKINSYVASPH